jgi:DNA-binding GntR family transcriptional regulator
MIHRVQGEGINRMQRTNKDESLSVLAYGQLRQWMHDQEYLPGTRLKEKELAARLEMSRTPVRDAIRRLVSEGLVQQGASGGFFVTTLDRTEVSELYACREVLEGSAAAHAAKHGTEVEIGEIREIMEISRTCTRSSKDFARLNEQFHQAIYDAGRNRFVTRALASLADWLSLLPGSTTFEVEGRMEQAIDEHEAIIAAIERRDAAAAEEAARAHIQHAARARRRMMFERG